MSQNILGTIRAAFTENFQIKLMAIALAVALVVLKSGDQITEVTVKIPLTVIHPAERMLMTPQLDKLAVTIRGPFNKLSKFDHETIPAMTLNLTGFEDSQETFSLDNIGGIPPGLEVTRIAPVGMVVRFEDRVVQDVEVSPSLEGDPARGYEVVGVEIEPKTVRVIGAESVVEGLKSVRTLPVALTGRTGTVELPTGLSPAPAFSKYASDDARVVVRPILKEVVTTRTFADIPIQVEVPKDVRAEFDEDVVSLTVEGPLLALDELAAGDLSAFISIDGLRHNETHSMGILADAPKGVMVRSVSPSKVEVYLRSKPKPASENSSLSEGATTDEEREQLAPSTRNTPPEETPVPPPSNPLDVLQK